MLNLDNLFCNMAQLGIDAEVAAIVEIIVTPATTLPVSSVLSSVTTSHSWFMFGFFFVCVKLAED